MYDTLLRDRGALPFRHAAAQGSVALAIWPAGHYTQGLGKETAMFFELRQYRIKPGKREQWVKTMEEKIIPFQISQGMVVVGSFVGQEEDDLYVWIRRFESEEERKALYEKVYESECWNNELKPLCDEMLDRTRIQVTRLEATPKSVIQ
jgi:hypothetical protein